MAQLDLEQRFPNLRPITKPPSLWRVNGCGVSVYGARDHDEETGTYVTTYCVSILFIPLLALSAYRVARGDGGWYFIGREPLSGIAKGWNILLLAAAGVLAASIGYGIHTGSDSYKAGQDYETAQALENEGKLGQAVQHYHSAINRGATEHREPALAAIRTIVSDKLGDVHISEAGAIFRTAMQLRGQLQTAGEPDMLAVGVDIAERQVHDDPVEAGNTLALIKPLDQDGERTDPLRLKILERFVELEPGNVGRLSDLALYYEERGELEKCEELLSPHIDDLGDSEGARIVGQIYADRGELEHAFTLLKPYTESRLGKLRSAEQAYNTAYDTAHAQLVAALERGDPQHQTFITQYNTAGSDDERMAITQKYFAQKLDSRHDIVAKRQAVEQHMAVVRVALDLGIVRLRRGQGMTDPTARQAEFKEAEDLFLAIRGVAGATAEYQLFFGQVNYWLGKHAEGKKQFEQLLASNRRDPMMLIAVADVLRKRGRSRAGQADGRRGVQRGERPGNEVSRRRDARGDGGRSGHHDRLAQPRRHVTAGDQGEPGVDPRSPRRRGRAGPAGDPPLPRIDRRLRAGAREHVQVQQHGPGIPVAIPADRRRRRLRKRRGDDPSGRRT